MVVRTLEELKNLGRIKFPADEMFRSARFLTAADGLGFSYNENSVKKGTDLVVWLKHHCEANYIVSGKGEVTDLTRDTTWALEPGSLYVVGPNDRHRLHLTTDERHISIFCPPLTGDERFDADGSYAPSGPIETTDRRMFVKCVDELRNAGMEVRASDGRARTIRMLTESDGVGFELLVIHFAAGAELDVHDERHWQANHILSGSSELTDLETDQSWEHGRSIAYAAEPRDRHRQHVESDIHLLRMLRFK